MGRRGLVIGLAIAGAIAVALFVVRQWWTSSSEDAAEAAQRTSTVARTPPLRTLQGKPVCAPDANPLRGDCLPAYLANLPPHPGPAGNATVEGVDSNHDGIRDDIEIFIAENYGYSERAVRALRSIARDVQRDLVDPPRTPEEAVARVNARRSIDCYGRTVDWETRVSRRAMMDVIAETVNTPARFELFRRKEKLLAGQVVEGVDPRLTIEEICGYDPAKLKN
ncbi:MAG: hypothetical protein ACK4V1_11460 [Burkholderiaceae bacterium]